MYITMTKTVEIDGQEFAEGSTYEMDEATATKWVEAGRCEKAEDPSKKLFEKVTAAVDAKISAAVDGIAESIQVKTDAPRVNVKPERKSLADFIKLYATDQDKLRNKYGEKVLSIGSDTAVVPAPLAEEVLRADKGEQDVLSLVKQVPMTSSTLKFPVLNQAGQTPSGGSSSFYGGIVGAFDSEGDDANATEPAWASITLTAARYTMYTYQELEFTQDSVVAENEIVGDFRAAYRDHMSQLVMAGAASVIGIIDNAATASVPRTTASTIKHADVAKMLGRRASVSGNWTWIVSPTGYSKLLQLETSSGYPVFQPALHNQLYGIPIVVTEHAATLGSSGDLCLANLQRGYIFGNRMQAEVSFSDHVGFLKSRRMFKLVARVTGRCVHADTITAADGSTELSDTIQLDASTS